ncbi:Electron transport complex protein RnfD [Lachnospiraceae bacterium TWA4]|nr:Electron transport complex protein RnfD [Lachnospiraceae bacterium TWA4]
MSKKLNVSASPHVRSNVTTASLMRDVVIAMIPATLLGIYNCFRMSTDAGISSILVVLLCCVTCVLAEYLFEKGTKKPITIGDYSAVVTGLILALNMPTAMKYGDLWICVLGGAFAIIVVKMLYGGLGQNFMNPALAARCFLLISFAGKMTQFIPENYDSVTSATPLGDLKANGLTEMLSHYNLTDLVIGTIPGTIGETSVIALLIGAAYLLYKKVINWRIPCTYIVVEAVIALIYGLVTLGGGDGFTYMLVHICGGGLIFGAFFMATDYVTSPITPKGQIVFGACLGILTALFRIFGGSAEGVSYAIIFCNILVPLIERFTLPVPFGKEVKKND